MKKLFLLLCIALAGQKGLAQSVTINKTDGSKVTFTAAEIKNIEFNAGAQQADTTLFHTYKGYITVTNSMFQNKYFGDKAEIRVLKTRNGATACSAWICKVRTFPVRVRSKLPAPVAVQKNMRLLTKVLCAT